MPTSPRYGGTPVISIAGSPRDQLDPLVRQRRRLEETVEKLSLSDWSSPSRCRGWSIQDVVAHLAGVNTFWTASVRAGLAGHPTELLANFDPIETPGRMVAEMRDMSSEAVLALFVSTNHEFRETIGRLDDEGWATLAETPPGHLPIRLLASHALWDSWVHERDILFPLGHEQPQHSDEVSSSLRYVCALMAVLSGSVTAQSFGVEADRPSARFIMDVAEDVAIRDAVPPSGMPTLRGDAAQLTDALSTRAPFPSKPPDEWVPLIEGFAAVFATHG